MNQTVGKSDNGANRHIRTLGYFHFSSKRSLPANNSQSDFINCSKITTKPLKTRGIPGEDNAFSRQKGGGGKSQDETLREDQIAQAEREFRDRL